MKLRARCARHRFYTLLAVTTFLVVGCGDSEPTGSNNPPVAEITTPATDIGTNDSDYAYDGFDETLDLWYKDVLLEGAATDAEDGTLGGDALAWTTDRTDLQDAALGTGTSLTVRLYSDQCTGAAHDITLTATDNDGVTGTATREISIWTLC